MQSTNKPAMVPTYSKYPQSGDTQERQRYYNTHPLMPLQHPMRVKWDAGTYLNLNLSAVPANYDSPTYSMSVLYFNNGTPEEWLMFRKALSKVLIGQDITTGLPTYSMVRCLMEGVELSKFNESTQVHGAETL
jgi:hypothetical protein